MKGSMREWWLARCRLSDAYLIDDLPPAAIRQDRLAGSNEAVIEPVNLGCTGGKQRREIDKAGRVSPAEVDGLWVGQKAIEPVTMRQVEDLGSQTPTLARIVGRSKRCLTRGQSWKR